MTIRASRASFVAIGVGALALAASTLAAAQQSAGPVNWLVNCSNTGEAGALTCQMSQSVVVRETGQRLLNIMIRKGETPTTPAMMLTLPHGLYLPAGVKMSIDDTPVQDLEVQTCQPTGCFAGMAVSEGLLEAMRQGSALQFEVQDLQRRPIKLNSTLSGFTSAYQQILD